MSLGNQNLASGDTPSLQDYIYVADYTYNQGTSSTSFPTPPLTPLMVNGGPLQSYDAATGFYGEAFVTSKNQVIVGFEGTNLFTADLTPPRSTAAQFTAAQVIDDAYIYAGLNAPSYQSALNFTQTAINAASTLYGIDASNVFLAGHSLGAAEAEYVATQTGRAGVTFGTPGIPVADFNPAMPSQLTNYVINADPVGNYYYGSLLGPIVNNSGIQQFGGSVSLNSNLVFPYIDDSSLLSDAAKDYETGTTTSLTEAVGRIGEALYYHPLGSYAQALNLSLPSDDKSLFGAVTCFADGTRIRTPAGDKLVEAFGVGDRVVTASGEVREIIWLGHRKVDLRRHPDPVLAMPIRIAAHAFDTNVPERDLYVSPGHSICVDVMGEVLIPAAMLVNGATISQVDAETVTYWHVELATHEVILAEGLPTESYLDMDNRAFFAEAGVVGLAAMPDALPAARTHADFCRPYHDRGLVVAAARRRLELRAGRSRQEVSAIPQAV